MSVSKVLHRHILSNSTNETDEQKQFDIDHFIRKSYNVVTPVVSRTCALTVFKQKQKANCVPLPDVQKIFRFIKRFFDRAKLHAEAVIIALVYIERLIKKQTIGLDRRNWIPIVVTSLLTASKMWDDHSSYNAEFAEIMPIFTIQEVNELERRFLTTLNYQFSISSEEYARYYFGLRSLKKATGPAAMHAGRNMPKYYVSLSIAGADKVEKKTQNSEAAAAAEQDMPMSL